MDQSRTQPSGGARKSTRRNHIDFIFVSRPKRSKLSPVGTHADGIAHSDHSPMTVDLRVHPDARDEAGI